MINIPKLKMPTKKELKISYSKEYNKFHRITDMNVWYDKLEKYTILSRSINLTKGEIKALIDIADLIVNKDKLNKIEAKINKVINNNTFVKLNTTSPKDSSNCIFNNAKEVIGAFTSSMRVFDDLCMFLYIDAKCSIWFREYLKMNKNGEWRCFVKDKKVIGITQYFYEDTFKLPIPVKVIRESILQYSKNIIKDFGEDTFVFDIYYDYSNQSIILIEINPYGISDPCLLNYKELEETNSTLFKMKLKT